MGFDEFKEDRGIIDFIHNTRCEACLLAKMIDQFAETAAHFFNHHPLVGHFTERKTVLSSKPMPRWDHQENFIAEQWSPLNGGLPQRSREKAEVACSPFE